MSQPKPLVSPLKLLCGPAGTGKTTYVKERIKREPKWATLAATTGIAAVNLADDTGESVRTINSLLGYYNLEDLQEKYVAGDIHKALLGIAKGTRRIAIDECSMLSAEVFDLLFAALLSVNEHMDVVTRGGLGFLLLGDFCMGPGTQVMLPDGTSKPIELITKGDQVMGPDSKPRNVIRTTVNHGPMYQVRQTNAMDYTVNANHSLVLRRSANGLRPQIGNGNKGNIRYSAMGMKIKISAPSLIETSSQFRRCFVGHKTGIIHFPEKDIPIDPYYLGLWLGDGDKTSTRLTTSDIEVINYCRNYANTLGLKCHESWIGGHTYVVSINNGVGGSSRWLGNPLKAALVELDIFNNKRVPIQYLCNSEGIRLNLLAGIIDTDGCWYGDYYKITQKSGPLANDIRRLANSLGFSVSSTDYGSYTHIRIGGDTWRIPCKIDRKISEPRSLIQNKLNSRLDVSRIGDGEYFGFETDGDHLFLLADGTVTSNCQLPPVKGSYLFRSKFWNEFMDGKNAKNVVKLTKIYRQTDTRYLKALDHARRGEGDECAQLLSEIEGIKWRSRVDTNFDGSTIFPTNKQVDRENTVRLQQLIQNGAKLDRIPSYRWGARDPDAKQIPEWLELCKGAYVMNYVNINGENGVVCANGDCGHVIEVTNREPNKDLKGIQNGVWRWTVVIELVRNGNQVVIRPQTRQTLQKKAPEGCSDPPPAMSGKDFFIFIRQRQKELMRIHWVADGVMSDNLSMDERDTWDSVASLIDSPDITDKELYKIYLGYLTAKYRNKSGGPYYLYEKRRWVTGEVIYMPLRLAYAATVHKTQGLTVDRVQIDLGHRFIGEPCMMYVALSRCRFKQPGDLTIVGDRGMLAARVNSFRDLMEWF